MNRITAFVCLITLACAAPLGGPVKVPEGKTIRERFGVPPGYIRVHCPAGSFGHVLQGLRLKPDGSKVHLYDGNIKPAEVHEAVVDMDVGKKNLQQCADAVMRLRAEYLFARKEYEKIRFRFTNGFHAEYGKWIQGYRIRVEGNRVSWYKTGDTSRSYQSFRRYLDVVFTYAGTLSLAKELQPVPFGQMQVGDVLIQGGSPGHAVIVVDMASDGKGNKLFMLAQSYMPAQEIHVLKNGNDPAVSPWYKAGAGADIQTPEWTFRQHDLKRFSD